MAQQKVAGFSTPYRFTGKELDSETGLYYYGARYYDPMVGIWHGVDPLASKYPNLSPYAYVANNPINSIDPDGRDIIILTHGATWTRDKQAYHSYGHQAVLIGNSKDGYNYYSYDQDASGKGNNNYTSKLHFNSLDDFKNSEHNTFKTDYDDGKGLSTSHTDKDVNIAQRYTDAFLIESDTETDAKMESAAEKTFEDQWSLLGTNCTTVATNALDAGGFKNGEKSTETKIHPKSGPYKSSENNFLPATKHKEIEKSNTGTKIDDLIIRDN